MFRVQKSLLAMAFVLASATVAKADTWSFPFTFDYTNPDAISIQGSYITADSGGSATDTIIGWNVYFTTPTTFGPLTLNLHSANGATPSNSNFTLAPATNTEVLYPQNNGFLVITLADQSQGFDLSGTASVSNGNGVDQYLVDWSYGNGLNASLVNISAIGDGPSVHSGQIFPTPVIYPINFETEAGSLQTEVGAPSPVPEPSSLVLLSMGTISLAASRTRCLKAMRRTFEPNSTVGPS